MLISTYQWPLFILYKYIPLLLFLFPQLIHRTYQLRYVLHYFFDTYFSILLMYLIRVLDYYRYCTNTVDSPNVSTESSGLL